MKIILFTLLAASVATMITGCKQEDRLVPLTKKGVSPDVVTAPKVKNTSGGAIVTYTIPQNADLLYVKAVYTLTNGTRVETKSSLYGDTILIKGFGDENEHPVELYAVNRSEQASQAVNIKINPLPAPFKNAEQTMELNPDFGGVQFTWENPTNEALTLRLFAKDLVTGKMTLQKTIYSSVKNGLYSLRGFNPEATDFSVVVYDRWDNNSATITAKITPLFEKMLDKKLFNKIVLPGDANLSEWGMKYEYLYDGIVGQENCMHTLAGTSWPPYFTLDLGITGKLSRFILYQRSGAFVYIAGNIRVFEIYGREDMPADGSWNGWTKLRDCEATRPTLQGGTVAEDAKHIIDGDEFSFKLGGPSVRYIRIKVLDTWGQARFIHSSEITFFGQ